MLIVDDILVSDEIAEINFICDISKCQGACCIEGDAGAPLEEEEIGILEEIIDIIKPYMSEKAVKEIEANGVFDYDAEGHFATPLVDGADCVYLYYDNNVAKCLIEKVYEDKKLKDINWKKPISCHLYPIRISKIGDTLALNYNKWNICKSAIKCGNKANTKLYTYLKEPLIRKFGQQWYNRLCKIIEEKDQSNNHNNKDESPI